MENYDSIIPIIKIFTDKKVFDFSETTFSEVFRVISVVLWYMK